MLKTDVTAVQEKKKKRTKHKNPGTYKKKKKPIAEIRK